MNSVINFFQFLIAIVLFLFYIILSVVHYSNNFGYYLVVVLFGVLFSFILKLTYQELKKSL
jgi:hypothetical protein